MGAVLFVDDEVHILDSIKRGLIDEDYECFFAASGQEALKIMETNSINVIVTDMRMPEMNGLILLQAVKEKYPKTVRIVLSGYTQLPQLLATINQGEIFKFITKPWKLEEELKVVLRQALEYYQLQVEGEELRKSLEFKNQAYQNMLRNIDEVVTNAKSDVTCVSSLGLQTVAYITSLVESGQILERIQSEVNRINRLYPNLLNVVISGYSEIVFKDVLEQYIATLKRVNKIAKIDVVDQLQTTRMKLKSKLVPFLLETIRELFISDEGKYYLKFICTEQTVGTETGQIELTMLISSLVENHATLLQNPDFVVMDEKIGMLSKYVSQVLESNKCILTATRVDRNVIIKVQLQFHKNLKNLVNFSE